MTWRELTLGDCVTLQSGGTPSKANAEYWSGQVPWVSAKDMTTLRLQDTEDHVSVEAIGNGTRLVPKGTLLAVVRGMSLAKEFRIIEVQRPMTFNQDVKAIIPRDGTDSRFVLYSLLAQREYILGIADEAAHGTKRLQTDRFLAVPISLPSLPIQRRIASILSAYDDLIENNTRRIAILEEMTRRIYQEWFVRFRFPGYEQVKMVESAFGMIPEGWRRGPIQDLYDGLFDGPHATPKPSSDGPVFLGIGNLTESGRLDLSGVRHIAEEDFDKWTKRVCPQPGDIVFTYEATLNRYAIIPNGFRGCLGRRLALIRTSLEARSNLYLYCTFFSEEWRRVVAQNTLSGATVDRIPLSRFPSFPIKIPPMPIMAAFDGMVRPMFAEIELLGRKNLVLRSTRDLLLPKLISGNLGTSNFQAPSTIE